MLTPRPVYDKRVRWYTLGGCSGGSPWVLHTDARTEEQCLSAIRWQRLGQGQFDPIGYWQRCTFDEKANRFVSNDGEMYAPTRAPYTVEAWAEFCNSIGYKAPDLKEPAA